MRRFIHLFVFLCPLLAACSDSKQALDTWVHADTSSYGAAISPDGKYLLTGDIDGFARVWDLQNNKVKYSVQHEEGNAGGIISAAFSRSGEVLVTVEQNSIARWAVDSGRLTGYWSWPNLTDVALSSDGRYALIDFRVVNRHRPTLGHQLTCRTAASMPRYTFADSLPR